MQKCERAAFAYNGVESWAGGVPTTMYTCVKEKGSKMYLSENLKLETENNFQLIIFKLLCNLHKFPTLPSVDTTPAQRGSEWVTILMKN